MGFRLHRGAGNTIEPAVFDLPASGTVHANSVVTYDDSVGRVAPASASSTTTNIFGVSLDYAQGASDINVRVIPFVSGQIWEADCVNAVATSNILLRHILSGDSLIRNITNLSETATTGVFQAFAITGATTGSGVLLGRFLTHTGVRRGGAYDIL